MQHEERRTNAIENVLGVLRWSNARRLVSSVLRLEKVVFLGIAAEVTMIATLMLAALLLTFIVVVVRSAL